MLTFVCLYMINPSTITIIRASVTTNNVTTHITVFHPPGSCIRTKIQLFESVSESFCSEGQKQVGPFGVSIHACWHTSSPPQGLLLPVYKKTRNEPADCCESKPTKGYLRSRSSEKSAHSRIPLQTKLRWRHSPSHGNIFTGTAFPLVEIALLIVIVKRR